jgi:hypothetical protein
LTAGGLGSCTVGSGAGTLGTGGGFGVVSRVSSWPADEIDSLGV